MSERCELSLPECEGEATTTAEDDGETFPVCESCLTRWNRDTRNKEENAAEAAHERMVENYYGSSSPQTVQEQVDAAWQQRMEWRRR